ncbi:MAG: putative PurR-regulated permease PerM [Rickettsiales bacterium]
MKPRDKIILYSATIALFFVFLYFIRPILFPFVAAIIVAYFLNPIAVKITKLKILSRTSATIIILAVFFAVTSTILMLALPLLYSQTVSLANAIPNYIGVLTNKVYPQISEFVNQRGFEIETDLSSYLSNQNIIKFSNFIGTIMANIMQSTTVLVNIVSLIFITPILVFYLLRDWKIIVDKINNYLPHHYSADIRYLFTQINNALSSCISGQINVCLILGTFYAIFLTMAGLNFGFLIGLLTGIMSFIPYIGMLLGVSIAIIVALFQWGLDSFHIGLVVMIFLVGQIIESNFLTPKLVGDKVGLHAVWIMFGLFVFGFLLGFVGILLAMPLTAIFGVLIKFALAQYKKNFVD